MYKIIKTTSLILLILAILLNINWLKSPVLGLILGLIYFLIFGCLLGRYIFSAKGGSTSGGKAKNITWQLIFGAFSLLSLYSLLGAIVYYFYKLDQLVISLLFVIISGVILYFQQKKVDKIKLKLPKINLSNGILIITYLILFIISIFVLFRAQTVEAINTPWQVIPSAFFIIYFIATLNLILLLFYNKNFISTILLSFHFFLTTGIALIVYKLGYGFDPFIHQVTEQAIWQNGLILPKPFYYLGQYSIVIFLAHLLQVSVELIDKLLLPLLLTIFLPYTIYKSFNKALDLPKSKARLLSLAFLFLPFGLFIATTPQALANLFTIIILFLSFLYLKNKPGLGLSGPKQGQDRQIPFWFLFLLTLTTLFIHALAGIPILIYLIIILLLQNKNKTKKIILPIFILLSALALPLALLLNSILSIYKATIDSSNFTLIKLPDIFSQQYNYFLDIAYLYKNSIYLIFVLIAVLTIIYLIKQKKAQIFISSILTFIILIINAILLKLIKVSFIIDYEQGFFSDRVWQLAFYFLLPLVIYGLYLFINKAKKYKFAIIIFLTIILTASLYLSYPRFDDYDNSKFINLSQADFEVVKFIETNSDDQDYIVLANQMTSVAALKTFGFTKYYNGHYFYPIPTGGELYQYFLQILYQDSTRQTILEAMDLTKVETAYFVLPASWNRFKHITEEITKEADTIYTFDNQIFIYEFFK